ncbi:S24 family peptidase [Ideonella sp. A 288]|uniref:S24 family peptidase n=1 Tax=Ideonella sp. A 288 TaxID=1962181 RepID=UPI0018FE6D7E|nr:S24 family peptidase [Ideonella sp. A 288]
MSGCACKGPGVAAGGCGAHDVQASARGGDDATAAACSGGEAFALRVIGHSMAPEFSEGEILLIEPEGALRDGAYVLAQAEGEWTFRQLVRRGERWWLHPLNPAWPDQPLDDLSAVHGVVIQAAVPGRRRLTRHYV